MLDAELRGLRGGELSSYTLAPSSLTLGSMSLSLCLGVVEAPARDFPRVLINVIDVFGLALDSRPRSGEETRLSTLEMEGLFRTLSQKCSYGRMTRVYEFLICVERPGIPEKPRRRPRSAHFLPLLTLGG